MRQDAQSCRSLHFLRNPAIARAMTAVILRILAVLVLLAAAAKIGIEYSSLTWPQTQGTVASSGWSREGLLGAGVKGKYLVRYEYSVDGKRYVSDRLSFAGNVSIALVLRTYDGLESNVSRSPRPDDIVAVHYAPWLPSLSVLTAGPSPSAWIWGVVALLIAICLIAFGQLSKQPVY